MLQAHAHISSSRADQRTAEDHASDLANKLELEKLQCTGIRAMMDELRDDLESQMQTTAEAQARTSSLSEQVDHLLCQLIKRCTVSAIHRH